MLKKLLVLAPMFITATEIQALKVEHELFGKIRVVDYTSYIEQYKAFCKSEEQDPDNLDFLAKICAEKCFKFKDKNSPNYVSRDDMEGLLKSVSRNPVAASAMKVLIAEYIKYADRDDVLPKCEVIKGSETAFYCDGILWNSKLKSVSNHWGYDHDTDTHYNSDVGSFCLKMPLFSLTSDDRKSEIQKLSRFNLENNSIEYSDKELSTERKLISTIIRLMQYSTKLDAIHFTPFDNGVVVKNLSNSHLNFLPILEKASITWISKKIILKNNKGNGFI